MMTALRMWPARRWVVAAIAALVSTVALAIPTALISNPIFGRAIAPEWWSWPVTIITGLMAGMLIATYVAIPRTGIDASTGFEHSQTDGDMTPDSTAPRAADEHLDKAGKAGVIGGLVSFFAVGCPVCNKLVLIALGSTGAMQWFAPIQPILAVAAIALLVWALRRRLLNETSCTVRIPTAP
jgi:hypothetical protein